MKEFLQIFLYFWPRPADGFAFAGLKMQPSLRTMVPSGADPQAPQRCAPPNTPGPLRSGVEWLVDAAVDHPALAYIDLSDNRISSAAGTRRLVKETKYSPHPGLVGFGRTTEEGRTLGRPSA